MNQLTDILTTRFGLDAEALSAAERLKGEKGGHLGEILVQQKAISEAQLLEALAVMRAQAIPVVRLPGANVPLLALGVRLPAPVSRRVLARVVGGARGGHGAPGSKACLPPGVAQKIHPSSPPPPWTGKIIGTY